jgi:aminoglycoside 6-adenylyltransferase
LNRYDELIDRFISWAETSCDVISIFIVGSRARTDHPADDYSDLDLVIVVTDPEHFLKTDKWLKEIGSYWISFSEKTVGGGVERRVVFENALDVDFLLFSEASFKQCIKQYEVQELFKRGNRVLLDKNGFANVLPEISTKCILYSPPTESEFLNLVNDFLYHSVWTVKKLLRGELWSAKSCVDCYMKGHLLRIIECHTHILKGWDYDTWHNGRFLDMWAEQKVKEGLQSVFAHYDINDIGHSLAATMDLFCLLAVEIADKMDFEYPNCADKNVNEWVKKSLSELSL